MAVSRNQQVFALSLEKQSIWTANQIFQSTALGIPISEPTITQTILVSIAQDCREFMQTAFTNESQTGADWQWTFTSPGGTQRTLVCQAKQLNLATGAYPQLTHRVGFAGPLQVDVLLNYAASLQNAEAWYVLYNSGTPNNQGNFDMNNCGCFIVKASDMQTQINKSVSAERVGDTSLTWNEIKQFAAPWESFARFPM